ncbi:MAG: molecular chaperone HtpG [Oscillospiraceae bacterium]|jgi:molecular chaperone HtpG|nr:molecular chaperone HtpG [Oscillospiraceae bacterium]
MAKKQFKSESKRLLELMIGSIYTHREIFLRELISNASDAIDKLVYRGLTDDSVTTAREDFAIEIRADAEARTLTVSDNGIGMTAEELENNLGVIARSGSFKFRREADGKDGEPDIIGQFGVGFYSAFMVASKVTVVSRAFGEETAHVWESEGSDGYTVSDGDRAEPGTDVIMYIKPDTDDEKYGEFLGEYTLHSLVKKYSDYIRHPIYMDVTKSRRVDGEPDADGKSAPSWEDYTEREVVNSRVPLWQRPKSEVTDEQYAEFFKNEFSQEDDPAAVVRVDAEGAVSYRSVLFVPGKAPYDYYTRDYEPGLKLYASGVLIMERCAELLPEHFRFARGVVDSPDLSLNISRELLQHDRQLRVIASSLEKKLRAELLRLLEADREKYDAFWAQFGLQIKYGFLQGYGENRDNLLGLLLFRSAKSDKLITLKEYEETMLADQPFAYYAVGSDAAALRALPQSELVLERGYDILLMTDEIDDFAAQMIGKTGEKELKSVRADDLGLRSEDEKKSAGEKEKASADLLAFVKETLGGRVASVRLSQNLKAAASALTAQGSVTLEMEKYFSSVSRDGAENVKAERVLELNPEHALFAKLGAAYSDDRDRAAKLAEVLCSLAELTAGVGIADAAAFARTAAELI